MSFTENQNPEFEHAVAWPRWLSELQGLWPSKHVKLGKSMKAVFAFVVFYFMMFQIIPCALYLFLIEKSFAGRLRIFGPFSFGLMNLYKYLDIFFNQSSIRKFIDRVQEDYCPKNVENAEQRAIMRKYADSASKFIKWYVIFYHGSAIAYAGITPITKEPMVIGNVTYKFLAYPAYFIVIDPSHNQAFFYFVYISQIISSQLLVLVSCGICSIAIMSVMHICGQCAIVNHSIKNLNFDHGNQDLAKIVKRHLNLIKFAKDLEKSFYRIAACEMAGCTFNMCMLSYYTITESGQGEYSGPATYVLLLGAVCYNIFSFCYIGDRLTESCENVGKLTYMTDWYKFPGKDAKHLMMIIATSIKPPQMTSGKMIYLSIRTFANVVKASASYLNMLLTVSANR